ncbi:hypothetical protein [Halobellus sp. GM3]|uniref:hypothetical protein n=1 Tax=Halobellus sp. GM3 TaxID=3458410 RepID=UPI00403D6B41
MPERSTPASGLSRRRVLYGIATAGAAAASGSGVAAVLTDAERTEATLAAGSLDLDVDVLSPTSWKNDAYTGSVGLHSTQTAEFELSVDDNPAYVWLVSDCPACEAIEEKLRITVELRGDGSGATELFSDGTLRSFRERYGSGGLLSETALPTGGETWTVSFTWSLSDPVPNSADVDFGFRFYAVQERHLADPQSFDLNLDREACGDCEDDNGGDEQPCGKEISYVAFCSDETLDSDDVSFERQACGDGGDLATLEITAIPDHVNAVLLKYGRNLDVFTYDAEDASPGFSVTTGGANSDLDLAATYEQTGGSEFPGSGPPTRSNSDPCPGEYGYKHEFDGGEGEGQ